MASAPAGTLRGVASEASAVEVLGVAKSFGRATVLRGVDLAVPPGSIVALLGPSGCGKTTLLRTIAGLERIDEGSISVGGTVVAARGHHLPPERRSVGMVFQDWALFPHLDVGRNVGYGLPRRERNAGRVERALDLVGLGGMARRSPSTLSGGQKQRVALARAIAPEPAVLLLDEPFSNLDTTLRVQVRTELHRLLVELRITAVFVTHDQEEAFVLGDEVAVMLDGSIVQQATPAELYARPATPWVAGFVGEANLLPATADGSTATTAAGPVPLHDARHGACTVLLRPEDLTLTGGGPDIVELTEFYGHDTMYLVRTAAGPTVRARLTGAPRHGRGDAVAVGYAGTPASAFPGPPAG
jgi:iron(III) transport system ATP-binding protein